MRSQLMLTTAPVLRRRFSSSPWLLGSGAIRRWASSVNGKGHGNGKGKRESGRPNRNHAKGPYRGKGPEDTWMNVVPGANGRPRSAIKADRAHVKAVEREARDKVKRLEDRQRAKAKPKSRDEAPPSPKPSLMEQLFPEETRRYAAAESEPERHVPRLPIDQAMPFNARRDAINREKARLSKQAESDAKSPARAALRASIRQQDASGDQAAVLVLSNASTNLVEEDFRRLVPQGRHMEGWALGQGDILKVIPGRNLTTLAQENYYYLLFSSNLSAFSYQSNATRIFNLVQKHMPSSLASSMTPPEGYMISGIDAASAMSAFALVPPSQNLQLRLLRPPFSPVVESIVKHSGYASIVNNGTGLPHQVRLTFEGPQLQIGIIRHILLSTAAERGLGWSGGDELVPDIVKWEPKAQVVSPIDKGSDRARRLARILEQNEPQQSRQDADTSRRARGSMGIVGTSGRADAWQLPRRTPGEVYLVGFQTEAAAKQFTTYWHRREMVAKDVRGEEDDLPAVTNVDMLW